MTIANLKPEDQQDYDTRFELFLAKMVEVAHYNPRRKYLYPIMQGVPFKDLEVALDMATLQRANAKSNDN